MIVVTVVTLRALIALVIIHLLLLILFPHHFPGQGRPRGSASIDQPRLVHHHLGSRSHFLDPFPRQPTNKRNLP